MIGIIDCDIGNLGSLRNAFAFLDAQTEVIRDPAQLAGYRAIVLPGVGAFDPAMLAVERRGFAPAIRDYAASGRPVMGICLGLQILCNGSEEGQQPGLGLIDGDIVNLRALGCTGKIPHVGFNSIARIEGSSGFLEPALQEDFYFVHSFALRGVAARGPAPATAWVEYEGVNFVAALQFGNIFATQFHPEKSGGAGLALLRRFLSC